MPAGMFLRLDEEEMKKKQSPKLRPKQKQQNRHES
jgi:hypothetical protein